MINTILIVDDEVSVCKMLKKFFDSKGYNTYIVHDGASAIKLCQTTPVDLVLLDLRLPDMWGLDVLKNIKLGTPSTGVIIITAHGDIETAVKAIKLKADNFILKPVDLNTLETIVEKSLENYRTKAEVQYLKKKLSTLEGAGNLQNLNLPPDVYHAVRLLGDNYSTNVLILGETGTGKGVVAKIIHELSERRNRQFVEINCAGLSNELLESELFGHERGAFTDAKTSKKGLMEVAGGGSLLLDEVADLPKGVQAKLLRVIEDKTFRRLGGTANIKVDVRIMAATNANLEKAIRTGGFREDLYYRLNVMPITIPPLRERRDDILRLANEFLGELSKKFRKEITGFSPEAEAMLLYYSWPGNIRELKNVIERAVILCEENEIGVGVLPDNMRSKVSSAASKPFDGDMSLESVEKLHLERVLSSCNGNRSNAAKLLGIHRATLIKKIKKYNFQI